MGHTFEFLLSGVLALKPAVASKWLLSHSPLLFLCSRSKHFRSYQVISVFYRTRGALVLQLSNTSHCFLQFVTELLMFTPSSFVFRFILRVGLKVEHECSGGHFSFYYIENSTPKYFYSSTNTANVPCDYIITAASLLQQHWRQTHLLYIQAAPVGLNLVVVRWLMRFIFRIFI